MIDSITFDTKNNVIIVTLDDGTSTIYTQDMATQYITNFPNRVSDIAAMGW